MKMSSYKNLITGGTVAFETGSRGDRKARAEPKRFQLIVSEAAPVVAKPDTKKPEKSG